MIKEAQQYLPGKPYSLERLLSQVFAHGLPALSQGGAGSIPAASD